MSDRSTPEPRPAHAARPSRWATPATILSAFALFAVAQALFILVRQQNFDTSAAIGLAKAGLVAALPTVLGLAAIALLVRRLHPASSAGDRARALRSLLYSAVAALVAWMVVDAWVAGPLVTPAFEPWIELAAVVGVVVLVARRPPSAGFARKTAPLAILPILFLFAPGAPTGPGAPPTAEDDATLDGTDGAGALEPVARPAAAESLPDVLLVAIDTFRADRIGAYGSERAITPEIDRVASEGFLFERTVAAAPWTVPSMASMLTGLPTIRHGAGQPLGSGQTFLRSPLGADFVTLAERFSAAGYATHAVVSNGFLSPAMGVAQGFDRFETPFNQAMAAVFLREIPLARLATAIFPVERWGDYRASGMTDRALEILGEERDRPLFLWVHYIDLHTPFQADPQELDLEAWRREILQTLPKAGEDGSVVGEVFAGTSNLRGGMLWLEETDRQRIAEYYDRAVAYVDGEIGRLFAALRESDRGRPVVAALTSDHGEEFWDHGGFEHGHDLYREVTRIPLVLWGPGVVPAGRSGETPVGVVDVAPTLLELAGLEVPAAAEADEGRSLVPLWRASSEAEDADDGTPRAADPGRIRFSEGNLYGLPSVLLEEGPWRFILRAHGTVELYHAFDDPQELDNRAAEHPELVERYRQLTAPRLAHLLESRGEAAPELDAETRRALQSLGYVQ